MLLQPTLDKLWAMRLTGMAQALELQLQQADVESLAFEERLGLIVDHEWACRQDRRLSRLLKEARLRLAACTEDLDCRPGRGLDRSVVLRLAACDWIREGHQVLISGPTGGGKTYLACALGNAACRQGISTRYYRVPRLLQDLALARADGSYARLLARLAGTKLLILDDWGITPLSAGDCRDVFELVDDRSPGRSTIVASQLPLDAWHSAMADPTLADAILDRLVHGAHKIVLKGESMRKVMRANPSNRPDMT
ncbi:MAG TPA: AAA family ATPase [Clostridiales bacterium]|nr:AAA family ATPase [Clostridiales bacterium]